VWKEGKRAIKDYTTVFDSGGRLNQNSSNVYIVNKENGCILR